MKRFLKLTFLMVFLVQVTGVGHILHLIEEHGGGGTVHASCYFQNETGNGAVCFLTGGHPAGGDHHECLICRMFSGIQQITVDGAAVCFVDEYVLPSAVVVELHPTMISCRPFGGRGPPA